MFTHTMAAVVIPLALTLITGVSAAQGNQGTEGGPSNADDTS